MSISNKVIALASVFTIGIVAAEATQEDQQSFREPSYKVRQKNLEREKKENQNKEQEAAKKLAREKKEREFIAKVSRAYGYNPELFELISTLGSILFNTDGYRNDNPLEAAFEKAKEIQNKLEGIGKGTAIDERISLLDRRIEENKEIQQRLIELEAARRDRSNELIIRRPEQLRIARMNEAERIEKERVELLAREAAEQEAQRKALKEKSELEEKAEQQKIKELQDAGKSGKAIKNLQDAKQSIKEVKEGIESETMSNAEYLDKLNFLAYNRNQKEDPQLPSDGLMKAAGDLNKLQDIPQHKGFAKQVKAELYESLMYDYMWNSHNLYYFSERLNPSSPDVLQRIIHFVATGIFKAYQENGEGINIKAILKEDAEKGADLK